MIKIKNDVFGIFTRSVNLYVSNFKSFMNYMAFPVFGQIIGLALIFILSSLLVSFTPAIMASLNPMYIIGTIVGLSIVAALPGLIIFLKAFWEYLVAYGALNSMTENMIKSGRVYDFQAHTELIKRRSGSFVGLWLLCSLCTIVGILPPFWIIAGIAFVYFILIFQVFTFEPELSVIGCFKKSFQLIKNNFWRTFGLMLLVWLLTYLLIPYLFRFIFMTLKVFSFMAIHIEGWLMKLPMSEINTFLIQKNLTPLSVLDLGISLISGLVEYCVIAFTLPLRSVCWSLWYKNLNDNFVKQNKKSEKNKKNV